MNNPLEEPKKNKGQLLLEDFLSKLDDSLRIARENNTITLEELKPAWEAGDKLEAYLNPPRNDKGHFLKTEATDVKIEGAKSSESIPLRTLAKDYIKKSEVLEATELAHIRGKLAGLNMIRRSRWTGMGFDETQRLDKEIKKLIELLKITETKLGEVNE